MTIEYETAVADCKTIIKLTHLMETAVKHSAISMRADFTATLARSQGRLNDAAESDALSVKHGELCQVAAEEALKIQEAAEWQGDEPTVLIAWAAYSATL